MANLVGKTLLNRYNVTEFLGRGGMAEVYKVWDSERAVHLAMKVLHADLAEDKIFLRRFKREANNLAQLQHPHIVRFYGLEQDQFLVFMLMDFVEGMSLKTRIFRKGAPFTSVEAKEILKPLTSALHFAHNRGLVHCDIKPANIMLDKHGEVRLADFGIARMSDTATATLVGAGTPAYMSPEQIRGEDPTPQSDIYALGIVLYEMLTGGERPFTGEQATITGSTSEKVRWEQINLQPPPPEKWIPDISPALDAVILKCLEKEAAQRYQTALELLNALELATDADITSYGSHVREEKAKKLPVPAPTPVQEKDLPKETVPKEKPQKKGRFPIWGYILGSIMLLGFLLYGVLGSGETATALPSVEIIASTTNTSQPTQTSIPTVTKTPSPVPTPTMDFKKLYSDEPWVLALGNDGSITAINLVDEAVTLILDEKKCNHVPAQFAASDKFIYCDTLYTFVDGGIQQEAVVQKTILNSALISNESLFYAVYATAFRTSATYWDYGQASIYHGDLQHLDNPASRILYFRNSRVSDWFGGVNTGEVVIQENSNRIISTSPANNAIAFYKALKNVQYNITYYSGKPIIINNFYELEELPGEFYINKVNDSQLTKILCEKYYYWSKDESTIVCNNGAFDISTGNQVPSPYAVLEDYAMSFSRWDTSLQKLGFVSDGDIYIYSLREDKVEQITTSKSFSGFSWSPDGKMLVTTDETNIVVINIATKTIEKIIETDRTQYTVEWMR